METFEQALRDFASRNRTRRAPGSCCYRASPWLLLGGWVLMMPPVPLGTALPPLSQWSQVSAHKTADDCGRAREEMRKTAQRTVTNDPNASALKVAGALGQLQARCVERELPSDSAPDAAAATPAPAKP